MNGSSSNLVEPFKSAHFSLNLGTKILANIGTQHGSQYSTGLLRLTFAGFGSQYSTGLLRLTLAGFGSQYSTGLLRLTLAGFGSQYSTGLLRLTLAAHQSSQWLPSGSLILDCLVPKFS